MADKKISALTAASTPLAGTEVLPIVQSGATVKVAVSDLTAGRAVSSTSLTTNVVYTTALAGSPATTTQNLYIYSSGGLNANAGIEWQYSASGAGYGFKQNVNGGTDTWDIGYRANSATWTRALAVGNNGNVTIDTGNLVIGTSGKGIDFSATSQATGMTSELLADYEEGTWTPVLTPNTSGTITITSPTNSLNYTKIGRLVTLTGKIAITSVSLPLGLLILTGFPFTSGATASKNSGAGAVYPDSMTTASALSCRVAENATGGIIATPNQGDAAPIMQAGTSLYINIAYTV